MTAIFTIILTLLLSLFSFGGISNTKTIASDTEKKSQVIDVQLYIEEYYANNAMYPKNVSIYGSTLYLDEEENDISENIGEYEGNICYKLSTDGSDYALGIKLSNGSWYQLGWDSECGDEDLI